MEIILGSALDHRERIESLIPCQRPYFHPEYCGIMYPVEPGGSPEFFLLRSGDRFVYYQYVKRNLVAVIPGAPSNLYDIISHFDYGGYFTNAAELLPVFFEEFSRYCRTANIISEFVRLLPTHAHDYAAIGQYLSLRKITESVYIKLTQDFENEYSQRRHREMAKAARNALSYEQSSDLSTFRELYHETMLRRNAHPYYYFKCDALENLVRAGMGEIWYSIKDGVRISAIFILKSKSELFYYLGANSEAALSCGSPTFIFTKIGRHYCGEKSIFFLGGGDAGVYEFKQSFSKFRTPYCIGMKKHNQQAYDELVQLTNRQNNDFFPQYREKII